ncbi:hypothetical protein H5410_059742 [Solanum commersonii]|uniref:DUF7746 domain-containing protein n=1 Tax=Solanum commersonii TaxID=4109 RepID=A0A9J5W3V1_SOLCO|nr:hypothetical protein H5410_059742 [Solanum commersonii]
MNFQVINETDLKLDFLTLITSFILPNNTRITFTAFQKFVEEDVAAVSINEINNLISQNNYFRIYVKVFGELISSLDRKLDELTVLIIQMKLSELPTHVQRPPEIQDFVFKPLFDLEELLDKKFSEFSAKPIDLSEDFADEMEKAFDYKDHVALGFKKLRGYPKKNSGNATQFAHKPIMQSYYYSRLTPQDVLIEERNKNQMNTSYRGTKISEWNLDGMTNRQLTIMVHHMLMYATICKITKNTDRNICKMIIAGFTSQLRAAIVNATVDNERVDNLGMALVKNRENDVYTLVLTILEHFNGRFTNQYETVRNLLNGLRCRHLGEFPWCKDTYMIRTVCPPFFAKRIKKTLSNPQGAIPYNLFTYGKLIGACTQEGFNLCNELKLFRHLKIDKKGERSQLGDFCAQFSLPDSGKQTKHRDSSGSNPDKPYRRKRSRQLSREEHQEHRAHLLSLFQNFK